MVVKEPEPAKPEPPPPRKDPEPEVKAPPPKEEPAPPPPKVEEAPQEPEPVLPPGEFLVKLYRDAGSSGHIGVNVSHVTEGNKNVALVVKEVKEGLIDTWNRTNPDPDKVVKVGHQVISANGIEGDSEKMLEPIAKAQKIELILKR